MIANSTKKRFDYVAAQMVHRRIYEQIREVYYVYYTH